MLTSIFAHSHVLLVHGPIALVLAVLVVEAYFRARGRPSPREVVRVLLVLAAGAALFAGATGLTLASIEDFHGKALDAVIVHRNSSFGATGWTVVALALHVASTKRPRLFPAYVVALVLASIGVSFAAHLGGTLVHGEGYLTRTADDVAAAAPAPVGGGDGEDEEARGRWRDDPSILTRGDVDFVRDVQPIFDRSCKKCHGPEKQKGKLRLDDKAAAMRGGKKGDDIVPGDPDKSLLIQSVSLAPDDEDVMPEKGKLLSASEIELLRRWIAQGAVWPDAVPPIP